MCHLLTDPSPFTGLLLLLRGVYHRALGSWAELEPWQLGMGRDGAKQGTEVRAPLQAAQCPEAVAAAAPDLQLPWR